MKLKIIILTAFLILFVFTASGCGSAATPVPPTPTTHPGQDLVASRCATCHPITLVENSHFSLAGWRIVVDRMVASGASLNEEQKKQAIDYLAITYPKE